MAVCSFDWHNDQCERTQEHLDPRDGHRRFFCKTHGQWAAEVPVKKTTTYEYADGTTLEQETRQGNFEPGVARCASDRQRKLNQGDDDMAVGNTKVQVVIEFEEAKMPNWRVEAMLDFLQSAAGQLALAECLLGHRDIDRFRFSVQVNTGG